MITTRHISVLHSRGCSDDASWSPVLDLPAALSTGTGGTGAEGKMIILHLISPAEEGFGRGLQILSSTLLANCRCASPGHCCWSVKWKWCCYVVSRQRWEKTQTCPIQIPQECTGKGLKALFWEQGCVDGQLREVSSSAGSGLS